MLSVSGLHVGIVAVALQMLLVAMRLPHDVARGATIAAVGCYVLLIGAPPAGVRAAVMLALVALSRIAQRPLSPWGIVALGAAEPVLHPSTVLDLGWQLSVLGVIALAAAGRASGRWLRGVRRPWREPLAALLVSVVATIATAPPIALTFGEVSAVGPIANVVAAPLMAMAQPLLFLALVLAPVGPLARLAADGAMPILALLDGVARVAASVPGARLALPATPLAASLLAALAAAVLAGCLAREPTPPFLVAGGALALLLLLPAIPTRTGAPELHLLDVGQGDAIAIRSGAGRWVLVDAGGGWAGGDEGRATVLPYLRRRGGTLAAAVLTHAHADHVGGLRTVLSRTQPAALYDPGFPGPGSPYRDALTMARRRGIPWRRVRPGDSLVVDDVTLHFLAPDSAWAAGLRDPNDASTVVIVRLGAVRFLLTGDAERDEEEWLLARGARALRADVLKVGHHGSATSSTDALLDAVRPRLALVSVGAANRYGHPSDDRMRALARRGVATLRTDQWGTVVVRVEGRVLVVQANGEEWRLSLDSAR
jgi:competence protein ComEC